MKGPTAAALVAAVALTACGYTDLPPLEGGEELSLPTHPSADDGPAALISGAVELDETSGCVYLVNGDYRSYIVWPEDTRATRDPFRIVLADGREIREGDRVSGSGGGSADTRGEEECARNGAGFQQTTVDQLNWAEELAIRPAD